MIDKTYEPGAVEGRIYQAWLDAGAFRAGAGAVDGAESYCIVIPPPNVTGSLHIGHALNNTLQDILVRFERMRGKNVLWQPGTDHAGIATQMVVERQLMENQEPARQQLGRDAFIERVWEWKRQSGGEILDQLKRLGASCDWSRERFTMDEGLSRAVLKVFVDLYDQGLIYRAKRLVNWHPELQTAISDLEVENIEVDGHYWHFAYPIEDSDETIVVATTRPETMLGDTAVAVHPDDERYSHLVGKFAILPLVGRRIPIIADEIADPEQGSGAVKITPAHDFNDFRAGERHSLEQVNVFDTRARMHLSGNREFLAHVRGAGDTPETSELFDWTIPALEPERGKGKDRFEARRAIVERMQARGLVEKIEDRRIPVPHDEKTGLVVIEPYLTDQWFVDAEALAKPAIASVREGRTNFVPKNWENTYFAWMENIQPWCISRQLWWGHRIPAWYGRRPADEGKVRAWEDIHNPQIFVASDEADALGAARNFYNCDVEIAARAPTSDTDQIFAVVDDAAAEGRRLEIIWRDPDVLDTWFSSALWPFSTLGWPDETPELKAYYPTDVLVTAFDIIFFWVARMMMTGLHFMGTEPFHTVYVHALVRDAEGRKMSKSRGNVINPLELIDDYGADALRFTLAAMAAQGRDIRLSTTRVEGYRNFVTKLWNAARFLELNECARVPDFDPKTARLPLNKWIVGATERAAAGLTRALEDYRFNEAAAVAYEFVWHTFCDWYVEFSKPLLAGDDASAREETRATAAWGLDQILKILHPFMPFVTEELWAETGRTGPARTGLLVLERWPALEGLEDADADAELEWLIELVSGIRSVRAEMNVPVAAIVRLVLVGADAGVHERLVANRVLVERVARLEGISFADTVPADAAQIVMVDATACLPLAGVIDLEAEKLRLSREAARLGGEIDKIDKKLANEQFMQRAPQDVIETQRSRRRDYEEQKGRTEAALARLS